MNSAVILAAAIGNFSSFSQFWFQNLKIGSDFGNVKKMIQYFYKFSCKYLVYLKTSVEPVNCAAICRPTCYLSHLL